MTGSCLPEPKYTSNDKDMIVSEGECKVVGIKISLPAKCEDFLKNMAQDHKIDLDTVLIELCEWAFNDPEGREQF